MIRPIVYSLFVLSAATAVHGEPQTVLARVTVYWRGEGQLRASWNGAQLREGQCAVDPKKIPYGSQLLFPDRPCLAVDTGPAVINRQAARISGRTEAQRSALVVDRFFVTKSDALAWSNSHPHFMKLQVDLPASKAARLKNRCALSDSVKLASWGSAPRNWSITPQQWSGLKTALGGLLSAIAILEDRPETRLAVAN